jgi:hypothetical protein
VSVQQKLFRFPSRIVNGDGLNPNPRAFVVKGANFDFGIGGHLLGDILDFTGLEIDFALKNGEASERANPRLVAFNRGEIVIAAAFQEIVDFFQSRVRVISIRGIRRAACPSEQYRQGQQQSKHRLLFHFLSPLSLNEIQQLQITTNKDLSEIKKIIYPVTVADTNSLSIGR